ncbi:HAD hydrolase family protein [Eubacteriaceae bacterium ES3]|nr:HAD hydrolase family protein [Eubacteriaceae bacterium ES3]
MPKIGMRIFKTFVAVYLCFIIYLLRGEQGSPFYSSIAAILCMQPYVQNSLNVALNRTIGTFMGGAMGLLFLLLERSLIPDNMLALQYLILSLCVIPLIYLSVKINKPSAAYITCVVFMSITVTHGADINPVIFTFDRILDTLIGIFVSLAVNIFHLPRKRNKNLLFVTNLDGSLLASDGKVSDYTKIKLNTMIRQGALFTVATSRSVETIIPILKGVEINLPIIIMNGSVLYDLEKRKFSHCIKMNSNIARQIIDLFDGKGLNCFTYAIINDVLHVYYSRLINPVEQKVYHSKKRMPEQSFICGDLPEQQSVLSVVAVNQKEMIMEMESELEFLKVSGKINVTTYPDEEHEGYYYIEITSCEASIKNAVEWLKNDLEVTKVIAFGSETRNMPMLDYSDYPYVLDNAADSLKLKDYFKIDSNDQDAVVKTMTKHFYNRFLSN